MCDGGKVLVVQDKWVSVRVPGQRGRRARCSGAIRYRVRTRRPRKCTSVLMLSAAFSGCLSIRDEEVLVFLKFFLFVCFFYEY